MANAHLLNMSLMLLAAVLMMGFNRVDCQVSIYDDANEWQSDDDEWHTDCDVDCDDSQPFAGGDWETNLPDDGEVDKGFFGTTSGFGLDRSSWDYQILHKTVFAEARGEAELGQRAVAWVVKNRADQNQAYWGGDSIAGVCLQPSQFECWNPDRSYLIDEDISREPDAFHAIDAWLPEVYLNPDPTGGADHYNNPDKEGYPPWTNNVTPVIKIGNHQFYKSK